MEVVSVSINNVFVVGINFRELTGARNQYSLKTFELQFRVPNSNCSNATASVRFLNLRWVPQVLTRDTVFQLSSGNVIQFYVQNVLFKTKKILS